MAKLVSKKGYREVWQEYFNEGMTQEEAFWKVENEFREFFDTERYSTFESFYNSRHRDIKNRLSSN